MEEKSEKSNDETSISGGDYADKISLDDQNSKMLANNDKNLKQKCVDSCLISSEDKA